MAKKVTLLGDSIRLMGYGQKVAEMLNKDGIEVFQPEDNCRFTKYTLRMLFDYRETLKDSDVIHWNNGLWDCCQLYEDGETFDSEQEYVDDMIRIAKILKSITPNVIFATTTPTKDTYVYTRNDKIDRFNQIIVPKLKEMGVVINDLNSLLRNDKETMLCEDELHLSEKGIEVCANAVYNEIKKLL